MPASNLSGAVFLSYAREDSEAARRIAEALRSQGVEVWFDQNELRGGDAWDQKIRKQIKECALFLPIISKHTQDRGEGYFRLEWKLAVERTHLMLEGMPFLDPVVVDDTREAGAAVPAEFMKVQWTRLPGALPTPQFVEQIKRLLEAPRKSALAARAVPVAPIAVRVSSFGKSKWLRITLGAAGAALAVYFAMRPAAKDSVVTVGPVARTKPVSAVPPTPASAPAVVTDKSVAVLAFANLSDDKGNEYFSDGISEELLNVLAKIPGLKVSARTSAFYFKGKEVPIPEIAQKLGVAYVVEGSVRKQGERVRITAQLVKAADGFHVWSETFTRDLKDIFAVQVEIAGLIAKNLSLKLASPGAVPTTSVKAYELVLQARELLRQNLNQAGREKAAQLLQDAVAEDPQFLQARIGLVDALSRGGGSLAGGTVSREPDEARVQLPAAQRELDEARRIAPDDPWVAFAEALYYYQGEQIYPIALKHIARARALLPREPEFLRLEARILRRLGRINEAVPKWAEALQLDPLNIAMWRESGESFQLQRHYLEAANATARLAVLEPGRSWVLVEIAFRHLATADASAREELERAWRNLEGRKLVLRPFDGQSLNQLLPQWNGNRAELVRQAAILGELLVMNQTELPSPIGSTIGVEAGRAMLTMLALAGAGERDAARALAAAHVKAYGGLVDTRNENVRGQVGQWLCMAATWYALNGDQIRAHALLAQIKELDRQETDAFWRAYRLAWLMPIWAHLEPTEAAAKFIRELDEPMSFLSLDEIASNPWVYRPLLLDARIKARLIQQGKWLGFLADRVPEYSELSGRK